MSKSELVPDELLPQAIEILRTGCEYFEDMVDFERVVIELKRWCVEQEQRLHDTPPTD